MRVRMRMMITMMVEEKIGKVRRVSTDGTVSSRGRGEMRKDGSVARSVGGWMGGWAAGQPSW